MELILIKELKNSAGRILKPGQVGEWDNETSRNLLKSKTAIEYNSTIHKPYQKGAFVDLAKMEKDAAKTTKKPNENTKTENN